MTALVTFPVTRFVPELRVLITQLREQKVIVVRRQFDLPTPVHTTSLPLDPHSRVPPLQPRRPHLHAQRRAPVDPRHRPGGTTLPN